jgi:hypothetical protein
LGVSNDTSLAPRAVLLSTLVKPAEAAMTKRHILALTALPLLAPLSVLAQETPQEESAVPALSCSCVCEAGDRSLTVTFPDLGLGCAALDGNACILRDPDTAVREAGQTSSCTPVDSTARSLRDPAPTTLRTRW